MVISVNPITKESHELPEKLDDSKNILDFLEKNKGKKVIVVQGLGFVGAVMSLVCANAITEEYAVIGIDQANQSSYWKIDSINNGIFPLVADDPKIDEFFERTKEKGNFYATYDSLAYQYADIIIVDINLDVEKSSNVDARLEDFSVNLDGFKLAIKSIGNNCQDDVLILVETTVPPGTCEMVVKPIIEDELANRNLPTDKYKLGHSYERVMPGPDYIDSIREYPRVYSGVTEESATAIECFLRTIIDTRSCNLTRLKHTNASEVAKVLENSYRAMNIAFAVEWSRYAEESGVDLYSIVNAIRVRKTHSNMMYPGIGVGGYCLTKDPLLASWSRKSFFGSKSDLSMSVNSVSINDQMPRYAFERLIQVFGKLKNKKVTFLGVSYRGDVGDTRFSPVELMVKMVKNAGSQIKLHDPFVSFWQERNCAVESELKKVLELSSDIIIISSGHSEYRSETTIGLLMSINPLKIFDTIGLFDEDQLSALRSRHQVSVLGRGDI
tara:strand:+ start:29 stop:1519 length:1491 start_codon:yes stop_codon:yes gene_type:complete